MIVVPLAECFALHGAHDFTVHLLPLCRIIPQSMASMSPDLIVFSNRKMRLK